MPLDIATLDFGSGDVVAQAVVTGQTQITSAAFIEAFLQGDTTADHTDTNHIVAASLISLACGSIVDGVGFTITGIAEQTMYGQFKVRWVWR